MSHLLNFLIPQRLRLSGVFRQFTQAITANDNTPFGILLIMPFQVILDYSSMSRLLKSPWNVNILTLLF